jgi:GMP synthase-like glutamine amidotransferase
MRVLFLRHDHVSLPGLVAEAFADRGFDIVQRNVVPPHRFGDPAVEFAFPEVDEHDVVVPLGSPWGAWEDERIGSWLLPELEWLRALHARRVPVLGICFGGQVLARALGGTVAPAPRAEIGYTMLHTDDPDLIAPGPWFQFHFDRWTLPPGATEIARTPVASQAFVQDRSLGLQFHPEVDSVGLRRWLEEGDVTSVEADGQDPAALLTLMESLDDAGRQRAAVLVDAFLDRVAFP